MDRIEERQLNRTGLLDTTALKLIAVFCMLIDHVGYIFFPYLRWMRIIGRLSMPVYCFCISEGLIHTRDRKNYLLRVLVFALISELPFDLAFNNGLELTSQNVMFTFACAIPGIDLCEYILSRSGSFSSTVFALTASLLFGALAEAIHTDYGIFGVILVYIFYFFRSYPFLRLAAAALFVTATCWNDLQMYCLPAFILLAAYNGRRGAGLKYLFYSFYPVHLAVLALIDRFLP
ncbi:MAG: TraX protein [Oscillospiraceae bacterium]|nr:TraX protein [Oscillospiraceae bacterium]